MVTADLKKNISLRRKELNEENATVEKTHLRGKWVTDNNALQNPEVLRREKFQRRAPKQIAKMNVFRTEAQSNGLEVEDGEVTDRVTQHDILSAVDIQTQNKKFDIVLDKLGPYKIDFSLNGTHLALGGLRGHLATIGWKNFALEGEAQLKDKINDISFLVDHSMVAVAQKKFVYMYTKEGVEMHILSKMTNMDKLTYLPRYMLLAATSSVYSTMQYLDISTGQELGCKPPAIMKDPTACVKANPATGVVASCDLRGVVKFWSPSVVDPLLQLKAHRGPIYDIAFHDTGRFFVTLGGDHKLKIWDCRTMRALEEFAVTYCFDTVDVSSSGLVAMGGGTNIQIWKDMFSASKPSSPFMKFGLGYGNIATQVKFCPFEDVLGIGHSRGFSSLLIPGSGEANPDIYYANPYETERHRKDRVVTTLLDKLPPDTISMDLQIAGVNEERLKEYAKNLALNRRAKKIREKKHRRVDKSLGEDAPTGLTAAVGNDDEVDEDIGFKEKGVTKELKSKAEIQKIRKMNKWDKKDSADKVRSKQTMRHSKIVQKKRSLIVKSERRARNGGDAVAVSGDDERPASKRRIEVQSPAGETLHHNAAFRRFLSKDE